MNWSTAFVVLAASALVSLSFSEPKAQVVCPSGKLAKTKGDCGPATATVKKQGKTDQRSAPYIKLTPIDTFTSDQGGSTPKPKPKPKEDCMSCAN